MRYLLQRADNPEVFEEVDEYVFNHRREVILPGIKPGAETQRRYSDLWVLFDGDSIGISTTTTPKILSIITRILGIQPITGSTPSGWLKEPENVFLRTPKGKGILHVMNGDNYVQVPRAA